MFRSPLSVLRRQQAQIPSRVRAPLTTALPARNIGQRYLWNTRSSKGPNLSTNFSFTSKRLPLLRVDRPQSILQRLRHNLRHFTSSRSRLAEKSELASSGENATLKGRLKKLSREYGWTVVGVYLALSVLDFPFCFLLVRTVGTDRVGEWEHYVVSTIKGLVPDIVRDKWREWRKAMRKAEMEMIGDDDISDAVDMAGWGVEEANAANKRDASLATQLALAYAIHKSFIFLRVPLTAAVTPKVVKTLRGWGWNIGQRTTKEAKALNRASLAQTPKK